MKTYFAGISFAGRRDQLTYYATRFPKQIRELASYWDFCRMTPERVQEVLAMDHRVELFLDSGAYSSWAKGITIDIDAYADFVLSYPKGTFSVVTNLDVIPGKWGEIPSQKQIDESAAKGWENYFHLEKRLKPLGIKPLHVYHQGENVKWLKKLIDNAEYFGVSPGNDRTTAQKIEWLDEIMPLLTDKKGKAIRKFHGFGVTSLDILFKYPWYSVDSTSWVLTGRFGSCFIPLNGKIHKICFSDKSPNIKEAGKHFKTYGKVEQQAIEKYLNAKGFTAKELAEDYKKRDEVNIIFFLDLEQNWETVTFKHNNVMPGLF